MKVRVLLRAKKQFGTTPTGGLMFIYNDVFCQDTGIAFFPINRNQWDVVCADRYTGFEDVDGNELFETDTVEADYYTSAIMEGDKVRVRGVVVFKDACFMLQIVSKYIDDSISMTHIIPMNKFVNIKGIPTEKKYHGTVTA